MKENKMGFFLPFCPSGKLKDNTENFAVDYCCTDSSLASLFWLIFFFHYIFNFIPCLQYSMS